MSTIKSPASASSNLLQAPPPTRVNSPPPASGASDLNDIDLSAGPPLSLDSLQTSSRIIEDQGVDPRDSDEHKQKSPKSLPQIPSPESPSPSPSLSLSTTDLTTPGLIPSSSSSIPLVVVSPPESNHGSPIVSPYISPSSTHSGTGMAGGVGVQSRGHPSSASETWLAFEPVDRDDNNMEGTSAPNLTGSASSPEHLSEDWHPRVTEVPSEDHNYKSKTDQAARGASSSYANNALAPKNSQEHATTSASAYPSAAKQTRQEKKALGSPLFRRLMNLLNVHSAGYQDSGASSSK
ncbi:hypothetical protein CVT26_013643 [Gymnopilus dilepis]|uniref:Uncharacterized protein n=1 Tax=Gymnopilus dilepis TaxID=231916 RepID=A0A409YWB5_9AGAR|nr:hypothetical protein CVT26_013643 [Gymnopilus dilepis]